MAKIVIYGGGSITHTLIPLLSRCKEHKLTLFTSRPNEWAREITTYYVSNSGEIKDQIDGKIEYATNCNTVFESAKMSTTPYPMLPYMGILHGALGNEIADFLQGKESASQALTDVEAAYMTAAKEKGFIN